MRVRSTLVPLQVVALIAPAVLAAPAAAQHVRAPVGVDTSSVNSSEPAVAADGDTVVAYWNLPDPGNDQVLVSTSNGKGLAWSAPLRIDGDATFATKDTEAFGLHVLLNDPDQPFGSASVYAAWRDERDGNSTDEIWFNHSTDGGASWVGEQRVPKGLPLGTGGVRDWDMCVARDPADPTDRTKHRVYFVLAVDEGAPGADGLEDMYVAYSTDGGASFSTSAPSSVANAVGIDVDELAMACAGNDVYVAWRDNRVGDDDILMRRSTDNGATWPFGDVDVLSVVKDGDDEVEIAAAAVSGGPNRVAVVAQVDTSASSAEELRVNVSLDGGATFLGDQKVGTYLSHVIDVDMRRDSIAITEDGTVVVVWGDDRLGFENTAFAGCSTDGLTWSEQRLTPIASISGAARLATRGSTVVATFSTSTANPNVDYAASAVSRDGGCTFEPAVRVSGTLPNDVDDPVSALATAYHNVVSLFLYETVFLNDVNDVYIGGYRPQTLEPVGWTSGPTVASFDLSGFDPAASFVWVWGSFASGEGLFPGLPDLCIAPDSLWLVTLQNLSLFSTFLDPNGEGSTPPLPVDLPPGVTLYWMAFSYDLLASQLGELTDVRATSL